MAKPNYSMRFEPSEVGRLFSVSRVEVKKWAFIFQDYLQPAANPASGLVRTFTANDLLVFNYVNYYWESDPDIEAIKVGLNAQDHLDQPFIDIITQVTPLFRDFPEGADHETLKGFVLWGLADSDFFQLADSYKLAGDILVDNALKMGNEVELSYPTIYNYRHATELYLKATVGKPEKNCHELKPLRDKFNILLKTKYGLELPLWLENIFQVFDDFDRNSTTFRYPGRYLSDEVLVDIVHVKTLMAWMSLLFDRVRRTEFNDPNL